MRAFFVNSALAFACAELITAALHEAGHGLMAQLLGFSPHIYAFYENNPAGNHSQTLAILAAGPLASLVIGALFWLWYRRGRPRYSFGRLLLLWLGLLGVMTFVNYLIVTPFLSAGDTAQFADVLGWPVAARYGVTAIGIVLVVVLARPAATAIFAVAPATIDLAADRARRRFIMSGFYLPLIVGIALTALAGIGTPPLYVGYGLLGRWATSISWWRRCTAAARRLRRSGAAPIPRCASNRRPCFCTQPSYWSTSWRARAAFPSRG